MANKTKTAGSGRKKGTPNKLTHEIRQSLRQALGGELETLSETLSKLDSPQRVEAVLKLLRYVLPPIESTTSKEVDEAALSPETREARLNSRMKNLWF